MRRQIHRDFRKPLILMTPKSLLRHKRCVSSLAEFGPGSSFHRVLWDDADQRNRPEVQPDRTSVELKPDSDIKRVVLCSGKVYYDLLEERENRGVDDVYLMRVEQFYPIPVKSLTAELGRFLHADVVWCQEEPRNMGAWSFLEPSIEILLRKIGAKADRPRYVGRPATASTATGLMSQHLAERSAFLGEALTI